jgi:hypothetical protein
MAQTMKNYYTEFPITSAFFIAMIVKGGAERDFVKNKRFCSQNGPPSGYQLWQRMDLHITKESEKN